jgi:transcriptional regulator with XRE-family HTH domain
MTRLATILREQRTTYTAVAERAHLQPRTVRQLASGETPIDNATVGTVRRIAAALSLPVSALLEP